jgi:hypothetical protein
MIEFCGQECRAELNQYWDEVAAEVVCSAPKCTPDLRRFGALEKAGARATYRSAFLDELAAKRDFCEPPMRNPLLLRGLYEYVKKLCLKRTLHLNNYSYLNVSKRERLQVFLFHLKNGLALRWAFFPSLNDRANHSALVMGVIDFIKSMRPDWSLNLGLTLEVSRESLLDYRRSFIFIT